MVRHTAVRRSTGKTQMLSFLTGWLLNHDAVEVSGVQLRTGLDCTTQKLGFPSI